MKKRLLTLLLAGTLIMSLLAGCGSASDTEAEVTPQAQEETVIEDVEIQTEENVVDETTVEETTIEEVESTVEETTVEETSEEVVEDPTSEANSTAQILKLLETYKGIMNSEDHLIKMAQDNCETENGNWDKQGLFADGTTCKEIFSVVSIAIEYYENCLTGNEPWDVVTWMSEQACEKDVLLMNFNNTEPVDCGTIRLWDAIYLCPYLVNQSSIELVNKTEIDEYKFMKGEVSAYTYDLVLNGNEESGFKAVYDSEGNLLTIDMPDDFVLPEELYSFEQ